MIDKEILSYYKKILPDGGEPNKEYLRDHIKDALGYAENVENSRLERFALRNLRVRDFKTLLQYSIVLHDAGKAFLQNNIKQSDKEEYISFSGHEYISALLADLFVTEKIRREGDVNLFSITFAVLYHHHAMNPEYRKKYLPKLFKEHVKADIYQMYADKLFQTISAFMEQEDRDVIRRSIEKLQGKFTLSAVESLERKIVDRIILSPKDILLKKLSILLLDSLIACDYLAARNREEGGRSVFFQAVSNFYETWIKKI